MLAAAVAATALVWWLLGAPGLEPAPSGTAATSLSPAPPPLAENRDDLFALTIQSTRSRYAADEPIAIETTLRYVGAAERITVTSSGGGLVGFSIEQLDGPVDALGGRDSDCREYQYGRGAVERVTFQKSGGFSSDDPMAGFWRAFYADPQLRLPVGQYRISAQALYGQPGCGGERRLDAAILILVE